MNEIKFFKYVNKEGHCNFFHESDEKRACRIIEIGSMIVGTIIVGIIGCFFFWFLFVNSDTLADLIIYLYKLFGGKYR